MSDLPRRTPIARDADEAYCAYCDVRFHWTTPPTFWFNSRNQHGVEIDYANGGGSLLCYKR